MFITPSKFNAFASTAGGLRACAGALFASLEKYAAHFSNHAFGVTEPNNAPYTGTDKYSSKHYTFFSEFWPDGFSVEISTSIFRGASFDSVPPKAEFKKCAAYFLKEANAAPKKIRSLAGYGGDCSDFRAHVKLKIKNQ